MDEAIGSGKGLRIKLRLPDFLKRETITSPNRNQAINRRTPPLPKRAKAQLRLDSPS